MSYQVVLTDECWHQMSAYVDLCNDEIAAFGYITARDDGYMLVDELFLVPQEVSGAEVDFVTDGLPFAINKAIADGRIEDLRFCVHSHVNMQAAFSSVDQDMIEKVGKSGPIPWFVSAIFNKKGSTACRLDVFETGIPGLSHINNVELDILPESAAFVNNARIEEIEQFVKKQKPRYHPKKPHKVISHTPSEAPKDDYDAWWDADDAALDRAMDLYDDASTYGWIWLGSNDDRDAVFYDSNGDYKGTCSNLGPLDEYEIIDGAEVVA